MKYLLNIFQNLGKIFKNRNLDNNNVALNAMDAYMHPTKTRCERIYVFGRSY